MKKLLFVFSFFLMAGMTVNAQTTAKKACAKTCAKTCKKGATADRADGLTKVASQMTEAEVAATSDESIKMKECAVSGSKSYYQKSVCSTSGNVSWDQVEYCTKAKKFTKVASASMERTADGAKVEGAAAKKECSKKCAKTCSKGKKATS